MRMFLSEQRTDIFLPVTVAVVVDVVAFDLAVASMLQIAGHQLVGHTGIAVAAGCSADCKGLVLWMCVQQSGCVVVAGDWAAVLENLVVVAADWANLVVAAGSWTPKLLALCGFFCPVYPMKGYSVAMDLPPEHSTDRPLETNIPSRMLGATLLGFEPFAWSSMSVTACVLTVLGPCTASCLGPEAELA